MSEDSLKPAQRLSDRAATAYKQLVASSATLNGETDEFARTVSSLDDALGKLGLGVECWVRFETWGGPDPMISIHHEIGYARVSRQWGIALRSLTEHDSGDPNYDDEERWLFNDAPRIHRIAAIEKVPELLEELVKKAGAAVKKVQTSKAQARNILDAIREAAGEIDKSSDQKNVLDAVVSKATQPTRVVGSAGTSTDCTPPPPPMTPVNANSPTVAAGKSKPSPVASRHAPPRFIMPGDPTTGGSR